MDVLSHSCMYRGSNLCQTTVRAILGLCKITLGLIWFMRGHLFLLTFLKGITLSLFITLGTDLLSQSAPLEHMTLIEEDAD